MHKSDESRWRNLGNTRYYISREFPDKQTFSACVENESGHNVKYVIDDVYEILYKTPER